MHVSAAGRDADAVKDLPRHVAQPLNLLVGQGLRRRDGDAVAGVHTHRVQILNRADDDKIAFGVPHQLQLIFFPTEQAPVDQHLAQRALADAVGSDPPQFAAVVSDAAASAAHGERWPNQDWIADDIGKGKRVIHRAHDFAIWHVKADFSHRVIE